MKGYAGRFLRVGLSEGSVTEEPLPLDVAMDFIAGRGFGIKYLYDELPPHTDPLGEHNKILLVPGAARRDRGAELLALGGVHEKPPHRLLRPRLLRRGLRRMDEICRLRFHPH